MADESAVRVASAALNQTPLDWEKNCLNIRQAISMAKEKGVDILCLPELVISGYGCEDLFLSPWVSEKTWECLKQLLPFTNDIMVIIGLPFYHQQAVYNTAFVLQNAKIVGSYAKQQLAKTGIHYEPRWFTPWPSNTTIEMNHDGYSFPFGDVQLQWNNIRLGFEICEDAWSGSIRPACQWTSSPVDIIFNPSASHFAFNKAVIRKNLVIESSSTFKCAYVYANLLGNESGRVIYDGSLLIAQNGKLISANRRLSFHEVHLIQAEIFIDQHDRSFGYIAQDIDTKNEEFRWASSLALFDYWRKSKSKGFVLSLSGGADSSCIAVLIAEMVKNAIYSLTWPIFHSYFPHLSGPETSSTASIENQVINQIFHTAYQRSQYSSSETFESAQQLAQSIGAAFYHWSIDNWVENAKDNMEIQLGRKLSWDIDDIALQNIQARVRSPQVWMLANIKLSILLTTSNRSEGSVGYATMDGDTSGSLAPIAGVDKSFILQWLQYAENTLGYYGLRFVNHLQPTAELRPQEQHQTDENDLMPYSVLQQIESLFVFHRLSKVEIKSKMPEYSDAIDKYFRLWQHNQWKRERLAPSFHFDDYNIDPRSGFRFPILSGSM